MCNLKPGLDGSGMYSGGFGVLILVTCAPRLWALHNYTSYRRIFESYRNSAKVFDDFMQNEK